MQYLTDRQALQTRTPPSEMYVRESELRALRETLQPITDGHAVDGAVIHGPSGAGKTHAAKLIVGQLADAIATRSEQCGQRFEADGGGPGAIAAAHIDCWDHSSYAAIIGQLLEAIGESAKPKNTPGYELNAHLREELEEPAVVILDEADQIAAAMIVRSCIPDSIGRWHFKVPSARSSASVWPTRRFRNSPAAYTSRQSELTAMITSSDGLVTDPGVLDADFQPQEIAHRDGQLDHLESSLQDVPLRPLSEVSETGPLPFWESPSNRHV
ncbi:AAA family ATPase [Halobiforma nitratireducens]|uniref:AAA ATPase n=1 Tax=Halobiforma nitratireducens JCM 10879 TaxID=1227454 RepID=M0LPA2_9EURY|nr:AAA family ATPase [Halobiforma nitratireducens]EMA33865.1 AAA ATPase [Halobiforma nitratireducens JCM 10879]